MSCIVFSSPPIRLSAAPMTMLPSTIPTAVHVGRRVTRLFYSSQGCSWVRSAACSSTIATPPSQACCSGGRALQEEGIVWQIVACWTSLKLEMRTRWRKPHEDGMLLGATADGDNWHSATPDLMLPTTAGHKHWPTCCTTMRFAFLAQKPLCSRNCPNRPGVFRSCVPFVIGT
jgi:hypothetical protein